MNENRRSGLKRRDQDLPNFDEQRQNEDRRTLQNEHEQFIERFMKVPLFSGLTTEQLKIMLHICSKKSYASKEFIYRIGEESDNMFVLLKGEIGVMLNEAVELPSIIPAGTVGEMGIFTGEKRSASVYAVTDCVTINFNKAELFRLFSSDTDLYIKILLNVIRELAKKIQRNNDQIDKLLFRMRVLDIV